MQNTQKQQRITQFNTSAHVKKSYFAKPGAVTLYVRATAQCVAFVLVFAIVNNNVQHTHSTRKHTQASAALYYAQQAYLRSLQRM